VSKSKEEKIRNFYPGFEMLGKHLLVTRQDVAGNLYG